MSGENPNILLVTIDCLRYDRCGFAGHDWNTTPTLDNLASESYVFDEAFSTGTYTTESVPGIIAGQHSHNGAYFGTDPAWKAIPVGSPTIASHLQENGYDTTAVLTNPHLTQERNFDTGFAHFENLRLAGDSDRAAEDNQGSSSSWKDTAISKLRTTGAFESVPIISAGRFYQYLRLAVYSWLYSGEPLT